MSLQAIQQEMEQEAKIDKSIDGIVKRFLKQSKKKYRIVQTRQQADAILVFIRTNRPNFSLALIEGNNENIIECERDNRFTIVFLKSKNPHDAKRTTYGDVKGTMSAMKKLKIIL